MRKLLLLLLVTPLLFSGCQNYSDTNQFGMPDNAGSLNAAMNPYIRVSPTMVGTGSQLEMELIYEQVGFNLYTWRIPESLPHFFEKDKEGKQILNGKAYIRFPLPGDFEIKAVDGLGNTMSVIISVQDSYPFHFQQPSVILP